MIKDLFKCDHVGRMSGDQRREQILQSAISLFSRRGFSGTTTKEIARGAGVSEAMVFRHFSTKEELYGAILHTKSCKDGLNKMPWDENAVLQAAIKNKDDFAVFYNIAFDTLKKHETDVDFIRLLFFSALEEHDLAEKFFSEFVSRVYDFISGYIEVRQADGVMRDVNPRIVVRAFLGMLLHHSLNNILWDLNRRLLDVTDEEAATNFAEIILQGVLIPRRT